MRYHTNQFWLISRYTARWMDTTSVSFEPTSNSALQPHTYVLKTKLSTTVKGQS